MSWTCAGKRCLSAIVLVLKRRSSTARHEGLFNIITLYKNKRDLSECSNLGGILLLNIVVKLHVCVVLVGIHSLPAKVYPVLQCGYALASTLFGISFAVLLTSALFDAIECVYLYTWSDGKLFNLL